MTTPPVRRALISVSDKTGLTEFARGLAAAGIEIYSTGGTRRHLEEAGVRVHDVSSYTGFPEMMDGRLKTLHPKIFGGILCRHDHREDMTGLDQHQIVTFELVVVNLYPFQATIARPGVTMAEAIEQIDIGGPSLVRAAAKNHAFVTIATRSDHYPAILDEIRRDGCTTFALRRRLAGDAYSLTALYDRAIADYFAGAAEGATFPETIQLCLRRKSDLRYGENPHQKAAVFALDGEPGGGIVSARHIHGKELSYNNLLDLDSALTIVRSLPEAAAVVIKHNNPCGAASASTLPLAAERAMNGDPLSAFGSVLGFNRPVDEATAQYLCTPGMFVEAIVAPAFEPAALEALTTKPKWRSNVRLIESGKLDELPARRELRFLHGGVLVQDADIQADPEDDWRVVTQAEPTDKIWSELRFAWALVRHVRSNAIVLSREQSLCGVGAGQMSRVDSVEIAIRKAGERCTGAVLASDAFFPFPDSIQRAAEAGIAAVIQPGGSVKDADVVAACDQYQLPMILTGRRHFKH